MILGGIVLVVAQNVGQVVGTLLVEGDDAAVKAGMEDGQSHAFFSIRLHIPRAVLAPVVVVAPGVHFRLTTDGNTVNIGTEHLAAIDQQLGMANALVVVGELTVVVGPQGKAYPAPRRKFAFKGEL